MISLGYFGWTVVFISIVAAVGTGLYTSIKGRGSTGALNYILAGRTLTAPLFAASLIATWYGSVLASGEFIARHGILFIVCFGVPYYIMGILYAAFLSRRIRRSESLSIPETIHNQFGHRAGIAASIAVLVISIPAPFMLSLGVILHSLTEWPLAACIIGGTVVSFMVVAKGGLRSDVAANVVQVVLMYVGFTGLAIGCLMHFGSEVFHAVPATTFHVPGSLGWGGIAVWFFIAMQTFVDPTFHVRTAATTTPGTAVRGLFLSIVGWILFDGIQLIVGLYAFAYTPQPDPTLNVLAAANLVLSDVWKGVFVASIVAAIMSTLDGYALVSATTIGHDLMKGRYELVSEKKRLQIGLLITGIFGVILSLALPSITGLIHVLASVAVPGLFLPMLAALNPRILKVVHVFDIVPVWMLIVLPSTGAAAIAVLNATLGFLIEPMLAGFIISFATAPFTIVRAKT